MDAAILRKRAENLKKCRQDSKPTRAKMAHKWKPFKFRLKEMG